MIDYVKRKQANQQTKNLSRGGETRPDQQEKGRTDQSESPNRGRKMEPDQQKEGEAEQLSGTCDVSQHQALEQEKGRGSAEES